MNSGEKASTELSGLVVIDKPSGITSHDVVDRVRRVYEMSKVGHAGTLDPTATGVMLVGLGRATRLLAFLQPLSKSYRAVAKFGVSTTTQDAEGEITATTPSRLSVQDVEKAAVAFRGEIRQVPPMVSAVKVGGEPLYKAARRGEVVERQARSVRIYEFDIEDFDADAQTAKVFVRCSSGTYIRTLASDLGDALGYGAHLISLRRMSVGSFGEDECVVLEELEKMGLKASVQHILSMKEALRDFPRITVDGESRDAVVHGRTLGPDFVVDRPGELPLHPTGAAGGRPPHEAGLAAGLPIGVVDSDETLLAVYRRSAKGFKAAAVFV